MEYKDIHKLMEIQYLTGRLDELYKGYVPNHTSTDGRIVDSRISKYEHKLMNLDPIAFHLYKVQHTNVTIAKKKSKKDMINLLSEVVDVLNTIPTENNVLILMEKLKNQIDKY